MNELLQEWINISGDKVDLNKEDWGVPASKSWETKEESKLSLDFKEIISR